jgi:hypothetical protein
VGRLNFSKQAIVCLMSSGALSPSRPILQANGVSLADFKDFTQETTAFVSVVLPNRTRIFNWFAGADQSTSIYNFVRPSLPEGTQFELVDRDLPAVDCLVPPGLPIAKALRPINPGSSRNRLRLAVRLGPKDAG